MRGHARCSQSVHRPSRTPSDQSVIYSWQKDIMQTKEMLRIVNIQFIVFFQLIEHGVEFPGTAIKQITPQSLNALIVDTPSIYNGPYQHFYSVRLYHSVLCSCSLCAVDD